MRQIQQFPRNTLAVNPGGPAMRDRLYPRNIPDPQQRGIVTRYGSLDNTAAAAYVTAAFADPNVVAWQTAHSISGDDWAALAALIANVDRARRLAALPVRGAARREGRAGRGGVFRDRRHNRHARRCRRAGRGGVRGNGDLTLICVQLGDRPPCGRGQIDGPSPKGAAQRRLF